MHSAASHDPGGKVRLPLLPGMTGGASFSDCGRYRHALQRWWGKKNGPYVLWIGMNPSTAEADVDDPTIRRELVHSQKLPVAGYVKVNVCDFRATKPEALRAPGVVPCSSVNVSTIIMLARAAHTVVAAWGSMHVSLQIYVREVERNLKNEGVILHCLGTTKSGNAPRHPLYVSYDTPLQEFRTVA